MLLQVYRACISKSVGIFFFFFKKGELFNLCGPSPLPLSSEVDARFHPMALWPLSRGVRSPEGPIQMHSSSTGSAAGQAPEGLDPLTTFMVTNF